MAVKLSDSTLAEVTYLGADDLVHVVQNGKSKKARALRFNDIRTDSSRVHPLSGSATVIYRDNALRPWAAPQWFGNDGVRLVAMRMGYRHQQSKAAEVRVYRSYDGRQLGDVMTAFSIAGHSPLEVVGGKAGGLRSILVVTSEDASLNTVNDIVKSDDDGLEWSEPVRITTVAPIFGFGAWLNVPNGDGSPNANAWIMFGHGAGGNIYWIKTTDNGDTASSGNAFGGALSGWNPVEPYVFRLPGSGTARWCMVIRDDNGGPMRVSVTTDLTNWPTPTATEVNSGKNPLFVIVWNGLVYIYAAARRGSPINGLTDKLVFWAIDPATILSSSSVGTPTMQIALAGSTHMIGYGYPLEVAPGVWEVNMSSDETAVGSANGSSSHILSLSGLMSEVLAAAIVPMRPNRNLIPNGGFQQWTRGTTFSAADGLPFADRLNVFGSAAGPITREDVPYEISREIEHRPKYCADFELSSAANQGVSVIHYDDEIVRDAQDVPMAISVHGLYALPSPIYVRPFFMTARTAGTAVLGEEFQFRGDPRQNGAWKLSVVIRTPNLMSETLGSNPGFGLRFYSPLAGAWTGKLTGLKAEYGDIVTPIEPGDFDEPDYFLSFAEKFSFGPNDVIGWVTPFGANHGSAILTYREKRFAPTVSIGAFSNLSVMTASGPVSVSGIAVSGTPGQRSCILDITATGLAAPGPLVVGVGGAASILVSLDH